MCTSLPSLFEYDYRDIDWWRVGWQRVNFFVARWPVTLNISQEITRKWLNHSFMSNKYVSPSIMSKLQTTNMNFERLTKFQKSQLLPFIVAVLFVPSPNVLSGYFNVSLNLVAAPPVWILMDFVIQLLLKKEKEQQLKFICLFQHLKTSSQLLILL